MGRSLEAFLGPLEASATATARWGDSRIAMASYLHDSLPPDELITSVRTVLVREGCIAVLHNADGVHPVPGGRREPGESMIETLRREIMEEAGCTIEEPLQLGFIHFRHLTPCPEGYTYPYPDFCQAVFAARATRVEEAVDSEGWEGRVEFVPFDEVDQQDFESVHRVFVAATVECFTGPGDSMANSRPQEAPAIRTRRLWLNSFTINDAAAVFAYASNPIVSRYTTWTPHSSVRDAEDFIRYARGERYCWAIRVSPDGPVIGAIECTEEEPGVASIHYVLSDELWGRGIMTEAAEAVLDWAFESNPNLRRITTTVVEEHQASRRVLEKCGMQLTGQVSEKWEKFDEPVDLAIYGLAREAWRGQRT